MSSSWKPGEEEAFNFEVNKEITFVWSDTDRLAIALGDYSFTEDQIVLISTMHNTTVLDHVSPVAMFINSFSAKVKEFAEAEVYSEWEGW